MSREGEINCTPARKDRKPKGDDHWKAAYDSGRELLYVPADVVAEILSWLPVKSVQRLKSVCRLWFSIAQDSEFIHKHMVRATDEICVVEEGNGYLLKNACRGLILETASSKSNYYRIRNPSTKRALDLPDIPHTENSLGTRLCYVSSTKTFKVICACPPKIESNSSFFNILTVDVDDAWRTIEFPFITDNLTSSPHCLANLIEDLYVLCIFPETESDEDLKSEMVILDVKNEKVWRMDIPHQFSDTSEHVRLVNWAGKPSVCQRLENGDDELLRVWVVEDCKKQKWAEEEITIDLTMIKDLCRDYKPYWFYDNKLHMHCNDVKYLSFDVESNVVAHHIDSPTKKLRFRPSLVDFKRMKSLCL